MLDDYLKDQSDPEIDSNQRKWEKRLLVEARHTFHRFDNQSTVYLKVAKLQSSFQTQSAKNNKKTTVMNEVIGTKCLGKTKEARDRLDLEHAESIKVILNYFNLNQIPTGYRHTNERQEAGFSPPHCSYPSAEEEE